MLDTCSVADDHERSEASFIVNAGLDHVTADPACCERPDLSRTRQSPLIERSHEILARLQQPHSLLKVLVEPELIPFPYGETETLQCLQPAPLQSRPSIGSSDAVAHPADTAGLSDKSTIEFGEMFRLGVAPDSQLRVAPP